MCFCPTGGGATNTAAKTREMNFSIPMKEIKEYGIIPLTHHPLNLVFRAS